MRLVRADAADLPAIAVLMNRAYRGGTGWTTEAAYIAGDRATPALLAHELAETPGARLVVTRDPGDAIVGCVWLQPLADGVWYLGSLTVEPDLQGAGLGHRLLAAAEDEVRNAGGDRVRMTVVQIRDTLIAWYERRGYGRSGATEPFPYAGSPFGTPLRDDLHFVVLEKAL